MTTEDTLLDISAEVSGTEELIADEAPLLVFRVIGCTFVTILVGFTIIIYVSSGMTYMDCLAQIYGEFCILSAYMLILLTTTEPSKINKNMCVTISFFLHICFIGAFFFSFLEVLCICQVLVPFFQRRQFLKYAYVSFGWLCPLLIAGLTVLICMKEFLENSNCWIDMQKPLIWPTVIPIGTCICLQVILLFITFFLTSVPITVPESQYKRAKSLLATRWASAIILVVLTAAWSSGVLAYNQKQEALYAAFTVASIVLGVCIFTLRMSTDYEMRAIIVSDILCCLVPKKSISFSMKTPQFKKNAISDSHDILMNGKISEKDEDRPISHK